MPSMTFDEEKLMRLLARKTLVVATKSDHSINSLINPHFVIPCEIDLTRLSDEISISGRVLVTLSTTSDDNINFTVSFATSNDGWAEIHSFVLENSLGQKEDINLAQTEVYFTNAIISQISAITASILDEQSSELEDNNE